MWLIKKAVDEFSSTVNVKYFYLKVYRLEKRFNHTIHSFVKEISKVVRIVRVHMFNEKNYLYIPLTAN